MSKKITIQGHIFAKPADRWSMNYANTVDGHQMDFMTDVDDMSDHGYVKVAPATVTFEMPDGWDPRAQQIEALRKEEEKVRAAFTARITEIQAQINNLQALEMSA